MPNHARSRAVSGAIFAVFTIGAACSITAGGDAPANAESLPTTIDATCRERFLKEAAPAWKVVRERSRGIELELTYVDHHPNDRKHDPEPLTSTYCSLSDGVSRRLDRGTSVDVTNSRYSFKVRMPEPDTPYSLAEVNRWRRGDPQPMAGWLDVAEQNLSMGSNIWWTPMDKVLANEGFEMTGAEYGTSETGEEVVKIVYRYNGKASDVDPDLQPDGVFWAELLPSRFWMIERSGVISSMTAYTHYSIPFRCRVTTRFQEWNGVPVPREVRIESVDQRSDTLVRLQENRFGTPRECTRPTEEFFLPHYGLSEESIPPIESGPSGAQRWLIPAGVVLLILARMAHRRSQAG